MLEVLIKNLNKFGADLKLFLEKRFELYHLETAEKISELVAKSAIFVILGGISLLLFHFALLAVAQLLNVFFEFPAIGELTVVGILLLFAIIFYVSRQTILNKIRHSIFESLMIENNSSTSKEKKELSDPPQIEKEVGQ